ncbi:MAG: hypothetical protein M1840_002642 [Geoglossum simile]|nr:MAG: hypothetical protein M1840_002642 [Geoglossum simile]
MPKIKLGRLRDLLNSKVNAKKTHTTEAVQEALQRQAREYVEKITLLEIHIRDIRDGIRAKDARVKELQDALDKTATILAARDVEVGRLKEDNASLRDTAQEKDREIESKEDQATSNRRIQRLEQLNETLKRQRRVLEKEVADAKRTLCCCRSPATRSSSSNSRPYDVSLGERIRYQRTVLRMSESEIERANINLPR